MNDIRKTLINKKDDELKQIISEASDAYASFTSNNFRRASQGHPSLPESEEYAKQQDIGFAARHLLNDRANEREAWQVRPA